MRNIKAISLLIAGTLVAAASCVKVTEMNDLYRPVGSPIVFSAATGYDNGVATKAEYSGQLYGSSPSYERIDWIAQDPIDIIYNSGSPGHYTVSSIDTPNNEKSYASISGGNLTWADATNHYFYALYPAGSGENGTLTYNANGAFVAGSIPTAQVAASNHIITPSSGVDSGITKYQPDTRHYGYLVAYKAISAESTESTVELPFKPAVTTFEFRFRTDGNTPRNIESFVMSTEAVGSNPVTPLAGNFEFKITGGDERGALWEKTVTGNTATGTKLTNTSNSITVTFPTGGVPIPTTGYLDFSILALPIDINGVSITINYAGGSNVSKTLKLKDNMTGGDNSTGTWHPFTGGKKYVITNIAVPNADWEYIIEEIDDLVTYGHKTVSEGFQVRSYKVNKLDESVKLPVHWKVQYTLDPPSSANPTWIDLGSTGYEDTSMATSIFKIRNGSDTADGSEGDGSIPGDPYELRTSKIEGEHNSSDTYGTGASAATRAKLASTPQRGYPVGTNDGPFDLSTHPSYGNMTSTVSRTTANSYVVSAPGYYMFPCVYGNAITKGQTNTSAYRPSQSDATVTGQSFNTLAGVQTYKNVDSAKRVFYTPGFYNALNEYITDPWIYTDLRTYDSSASFTDAVVVWQDTDQGDEIIPYPTSGDPTNIGLTTIGSEKYIWFYIDKNDIKPGNIMIALRGSARNLSGDKNILWSWQIWVTEKDLTPSSSNQLNGYSIMPYNLGWIDTEEGSVTRFDNRELRYRIIQIENGIEHEAELFTMTQIGDVIETSESIGGNPYYQWGRKDPFLAALPSNTQTSRPVSPNPYYSSYISGNVIPAENIQKYTLDYSKGIRHPYIPYSNRGNGADGSTGWIGGRVYPYEIPSGHWFLTKYDRGPYLGTEAGWLNSWGVTDPNYWDHDSTTDLWTYRADGPYNAIVDNNTCYNLWNYLPVHFSNTDFVNAYSAALRSKSSCPYNLWNSYLYDEDAVNAGYDNKFKTVYDPCPPGFTVPTKNVYVGNKTSADFIWTKQIEKSTAPTLTWGTPTTEGQTFNNSFFSFTGARIYFRGDNPPTVELRVTGVSTDGFYWTDCAHTIDYDMFKYSDPNSRDETNLAYYSLFHSAISFDFGRGSVEHPNPIVKSYTRGSALSIRPMVDPKY